VFVDCASADIVDREEIVKIVRSLRVCNIKSWRRWDGEGCYVTFQEKWAFMTFSGT